MRDLDYKLQFTIYFDSNKRVNKIEVETLEKRTIEGQEYFCDDKTHPDITFAYPMDIVMEEMHKKLATPFLGKRFDESVSDSIKRDAERTIERFKVRLGAQTKDKIQQLIDEGDYWQVLFSLHPILEHRLKKILKYKSMELLPSTLEIVVNPLKEEFCEKDIRSFKHLTKLVYLIGGIDQKTKMNILRFNSERGNIAHELLKEEIPLQKLEQICTDGLKVMDTLETCFSQIIPKPDVIIMSEFKIISPVPPKSGT